MATLNYAEQYSNQLAQAFPYVLYFGALYSTPNNGRYKLINARTIQIPVLETTGRVDANRDTIATAKRNYNNKWETKTLENERKWSTLVHPSDISETNQVATITNITKVYNEEQKFPEMDAYTISKIYEEYTGQSKTADTTALTVNNVLSVFDTMMENMAEARVPVEGRKLYVTPSVNTLLKQAKEIARQLVLTNSASAVNRSITNLDQVEIIEVPSILMKTVYDFTEGWKPGTSAKQINMLLIHPLAVITPVNYEFVTLDAPSAGSEGKYVYYEESHEDVFILNKKIDAIQFNVEGTTTTPPKNEENGGEQGGTE